MSFRTKNHEDVIKNDIVCLSWRMSSLCFDIIATATLLRVICCLFPPSALRLLTPSHVICGWPLVGNRREITQNHDQVDGSKRVTETQTKSLLQSHPPPTRQLQISCCRKLAFPLTTENRLLFIRTSHWLLTVGKACPRFRYNLRLWGRLIGQLNNLFEKSVWDLLGFLLLFLSRRCFSEEAKLKRGPWLRFYWRRIRNGAAKSPFIRYGIWKVA